MEHPPGLTGSSMEKRREVAVREADEIKLGVQPESHQFVAWRQQVRNKVMAASGRGRGAFGWVMEIEDSRITMDELAEAGEFESLDVKLAAAVYTMACERISMVISTMTEAAAAKGMFVSGRQLLRTVY